MIEELKQIETEYDGLIAHQVVACKLFDRNQNKAIEYLNSLVKNGILKFLNGSYPNNQYYRFMSHYETEE